MTPRLPALLLASALLAACATPPPAAPPAPAFDAVAAVAAIRAAAGPADAKDELAIQPLRDPAVEDLRAQARREEAAGRHAESAAALDRALALIPDDPAVLQERAEAALLAHDLPAAATFATKAHEVGAQVGPLCRRHWATLRTVRTELHDTAGTRDAQARFDACRVAAPPRY